HEILEHAPAPRYERGRAGSVCESASETEPVLYGNVVLGDGDEAREPRFGGQEIVVGSVERVRALLVSDREQPARRVEQKPEIHCRGVRRGALREHIEARDQGRCCRRPRAQVPERHPPGWGIAPSGGGGAGELAAERV